LSQYTILVIATPITLASEQRFSSTKSLSVMERVISSNSFWWGKISPETQEVHLI